MEKIPNCKELVGGGGGGLERAVLDLVLFMCKTIFTEIGDG